jgi:hypothetical protein
LEEVYTESESFPGIPDGPGSYPGPFSVVDASEAVFLGSTPPIGNGLVSMVVVTGAGRWLSRPVKLPDMTTPLSAAFISTERGWVVGENVAGTTTPVATYVIEATMDGGRTWSRQYSIPGD